jgi:release factor glutamine methyltransferase
MRSLTIELARAGIDGAGGDVRRLMAAVLGLPPAVLLREPERAIGAEEARTLRGYVARRAGHEPVSRILGKRDFYGRSFVISEATLDPRPESETVVAAALEIARGEGWMHRPLRVLDVGTGSGCLLLSLLCELPEAHGVGTDISGRALAVARANAGRLGVADRVTWLKADALVNVHGPFHMLITNPPYVRTAEIAGLDREVRDFDPPSALDGGADGLAVYRRLAPRICDAVPDGWVVVEVGHDQADAVIALFAAHAVGSGADAIRVRRDIAGRRRCVAMKTRG